MPLSSALTELQGMEGDTILLQDIFKFRQGAKNEDGRTEGELVASGLRPKFLDKLAEIGVEVPAKAFRPAPAPANPNGGRLRGAKVPSISQLVRPERAR